MKCNQSHIRVKKNNGFITVFNFIQIRLQNRNINFYQHRKFLCTSEKSCINQKIFCQKSSSLNWFPKYKIPHTHCSPDPHITNWKVFGIKFHYTIVSKISLFIPTNPLKPLVHCKKRNMTRSSDSPNQRWAITPKTWHSIGWNSRNRLRFFTGVLPKWLLIFFPFLAGNDKNVPDLFALKISCSVVYFVCLFLVALVLYY